MLASIFIIGFSVILFAYWFRYSCILLMRGHAISTDRRFSLGRLEENLRTDQPLDQLERALRRDYKVLSFLLQHTTGSGLEGLEFRILVLDYKLMQWWYRLTRTAAPDHARQAVREMATILSLLVGKVGERSGVQDQA